MFRNLFSILFLFLLSSLIRANETILVEEAWINEAPPNVKVHAGYMKISNQSDNQIMLVSAHSPMFESIEFHTTRFEYGVAKMRKQDVIIIPSNSTFSFKPGNTHLMLMDSKQPVKASEYVPIELVFDNGTKISIKATIKKATSAEHHH